MPITIAPVSTRGFGTGNGHFGSIGLIVRRGYWGFENVEYVAAGNKLCDRCGSEYPKKSLRREWNGLLVCHGPGTNDCWEPRHPQDFVRAKGQDRLPYSREANASITFLSPGDVTADDL